MAGWLGEVPDFFSEELGRYTERTRRSEEIFREARKYVPYGVNSNMRFFEPYPIYIARGKGGRVWDADGNEYVDLNLAMGAVFSGHSHPAVVEAVRGVVEDGTAFGTDAPEARLVAKELARRWGLDKVRFSNSGAEATMHAIRIARAYTGKDKVIKFEGNYHGAHDYVLVSIKSPPGRMGRRFPRKIPVGPGIPGTTLDSVLIARYNDLNSVERLLSKHEEEVAAVIVEPVAMNIGVVPPKPGFLEGLRKLTEEYGALLIFDEVKTGVKLAPGGATEFFGIKPDLAVTAKSIGGGFPVSAIMGREEVMSVVGPHGAVHAGTFNANRLVMAAALATLTKVLTVDAYPRAHRLCDELSRAFQDIVDDYRIPAVVQWIGPNGHIYPGATEPVVDLPTFYQQDDAAWWRYWIAMMNRGIFIEPVVSDDEWTVSVVHTKEDIERAIEAFKEAAKFMRPA